MRQEFYKTTLVSKFIKQLISSTPMPKNKLIYDNDPMIAGCVYHYKDKVLYCTKTGRFTGVKGTVRQVDFLTIKDELEVAHTDMEVLTNSAGKLSTLTVPFAVTDDVVSIKLHEEAEFVIIDIARYDVYNRDVMQLVTSNVEYYDPLTHKYLGEYLRWIKNMYDLDLMPLYNCFGHRTSTNILLGAQYQNDVIEDTATKSKVYLVPIKFDKTYTIAMDSEFPVFLKAIFWKDIVLMDRNRQRYLHAYIDKPVVKKNATQFTQPFTFSVRSDECTHPTYSYSTLHQYERCLYLAIQVPSEHSATVTVLEGDYSDNGFSSVCDIYGIYKGINTTDQISQMLTSRLSLLHTNDGQQHPFSDKLIEYLLHNTIDTREYIDENVARIETAINYNPKYKGMWDNTLRYILYREYMKLESREELSFLDILGYVDSDIETAVRKGYIRYGSRKSI